MAQLKRYFLYGPTFENRTPRNSEKLVCPATSKLNIKIVKYLSASKKATANLNFKILFSSIAVCCGDTQSAVLSTI